MDRRPYLDIVRWSALYDLLVTLPFALPVLSGRTIEAYAAAHVALGFEGRMPAFAGAHMLFVNLLGSIVVGWSVLRLWRPRPVYGLYDGFGRFSFAAWQLYYLLSGRITPLLWLIFLPELTWGIVQTWGYLRLRRARAARSRAARSRAARPA